MVIGVAVLLAFYSNDDPAEAAAAVATAVAAAWDATSEKGLGAITISGATGASASAINGDYAPAGRRPGRAPVYERRGKDVHAWLFLARNGRWTVGGAENKDARKNAGWAYTSAGVAPGTLPHEAPAGGWLVNDEGKFVPQPSVVAREFGVD